MHVRDRRGLLACAAVLVASLMGGEGVAFADSASDREQRPVLSSVTRPAVFPMVEPALSVRGTAAVLLQPSEPDRPRLLAGLYAGFVTLQALDAHSTLTAVRGGRKEANPIIQPFADRPGMLIAAKAATAVGTIALSERLWRKHRVAAVVLMVAANAGYAAVVAHNYRQARR
jgi:hypothetical protein